MLSSNYGLIGDIIIGVVGGLLGGWIATTYLHLRATVNGFNLESILVAFSGAMILLILLRLVGVEGAVSSGKEVFHVITKYKRDRSAV